jgi:hypothetical protein
MTIAVRTFVDESPSTREVLAEPEDADDGAIDRAVGRAWRAFQRGPVCTAGNVDGS